MEFHKENIQFGQYIFDNHNFDGSADEFLIETAPLIGYLVHTFNSLDEQLNSTICTLINDRTDMPGAIIICSLNYSAKVELFKNLVSMMEIVCNKKIPSFNDLLINLKKAGTLRNAVVHAEWENMNEKGYTYVKMHINKNGIQQQYCQFTPESLQNAIDFIHTTYMSFDIFEEEKHELLTS